MTNKSLRNCPKCLKKISAPIGECKNFVCPSCKEEIEYDDLNSNENKRDSEVGSLEEESSFSDLIINTISWILAIPIFVIVHKLIPDPDWFLNLDRFLLAVLVLSTLRLMLRLFRTLIVVAFFASILWLSYGSFSGKYGFKDVYLDYKEMIYSMVHNPHPERIVLSKLKPFKYKKEIKEAIDFENSEVRNYALSLTQENKNLSDVYYEYRNLIQSFAIFKEINSKWNYVNDPKSREYFAKASESIKHLAGDCDDHSILMAACIKAIGGTPRLVWTKGHIYPELLIGTKRDLETINFLVKRKLFRSESKGHHLEYHIDENDQVWLNLDYTAKYPGGPFMSEEILGVLTLD